MKKDNIMVELTRRRWQLVRHIWRTETGNIMKEAMFWISNEKKKAGRPEKSGYELLL